MCPYKWYQVMRLSKDKKQIRYQMIIYAKEHGVKPTARFYATNPKTVRKWIGRFDKGGYQFLEDKSRRPHHSPNKTPREVSKRIVKLKTEYKRIGAASLRQYPNKLRNNSEVISSHILENDILKTLISR